MLKQIVVGFACFRNQSNTWNSPRKNRVGALAKNTKVWLRGQRRFMLMEEAASLQGIMNTDNISKSELKVLAGNAMNAFSIMAWQLACVANGLI